MSTIQDPVGNYHYKNQKENLNEKKQMHRDRDSSMSSFAYTLERKK